MYDDFYGGYGPGYGGGDFYGNDYDFDYGGFDYGMGGGYRQRGRMMAGYPPVGDFLFNFVVALC